jgi:hypothetical protein
VRSPSDNSATFVADRTLHCTAALMHMGAVRMVPLHKTVQMTHFSNHVRMTVRTCEPMATDRESESPDDAGKRR